MRQTVGGVSLGAAFLAAHGATRAAARAGGVAAKGVGLLSSAASRGLAALRAHAATVAADPRKAATSLARDARAVGAALPGAAATMAGHAAALLRVGVPNTSRARFAVADAIEGLSDHARRHRRLVAALSARGLRGVRLQQEALLAAMSSGSDGPDDDEIDALLTGTHASTPSATLEGDEPTAGADEAEDGEEDRAEVDTSSTEAALCLPGPALHFRLPERPRSQREMQRMAEGWVEECADAVLVGDSSRLQAAMRVPSDTRMAVPVPAGSRALSLAEALGKTDNASHDWAATNTAAPIALGKLFWKRFRGSTAVRPELVSAGELTGTSLSEIRPSVFLVADHSMIAMLHCLCAAAAAAAACDGSSDGSAPASSGSDATE